MYQLVMLLDIWEMMAIGILIPRIQSIQNGLKSIEYCNIIICLMITNDYF